MVSVSKKALGFQNPCIHDARKDPQPPCSSVSLREQKGEKKSEWGPPGMAVREATAGRDQPWTRCAAQAAPCWARSPGLDAGQSRGGEG